MVLTDLSDDDLCCVLVGLSGHALVTCCSGVCVRFHHAVRNEDMWRTIVARTFGVDTDLDLHAAFPDRFATWRSVFCLCHASLHFSVPGRIASRRAYAGGQFYSLMAGEYVPNDPSQRWSYMPTDDALLDLLPADDLCPAGTTQCKVANFETASLTESKMHVCVNGRDATSSVEPSSFPSLRRVSGNGGVSLFGPRERGAWVTLQLDRPCLLTGALVCNPGADKAFPVREAFLYVGMSVEEAETRDEPFVRIMFPRQSRVNMELAAFSSPVLARFVVVHFASSFSEGRVQAHPDLTRFDVKAVGVFGTELYCLP